MKSIQMTASTDEKGFLNIRIPIEIPRQKMEVLVVLQPFSGHAEEGPESDEWPEGYFEATAGAFRDDPISRGDQGELEIREKIE